ncbi:putative glycyl-radical enzyme activating enzyme YjjW [bioreactor metagenome]|uniref:Putative glycyl-radical enzyme activating enzyme YjjW n=1 Tax=bioreactor metagenome TaxID=1076179 RepID=A0A645EU04_9ZZZZ
MSDEQVFQHILLNQAFIRGITVSGGECTLQPEFIKALFKRTKTAGLSNLLDSNGTYDFEHNPDILADCDGVMLDIKAYNSDDHQAITDHDNQRILYNARWLAEQGQLSEIRTVIIPEMLDNKGTIQKIAQLLAPYLSQHQINYKLIKYRPFGVRSRYQTFPLPDNRLMQELARIAADAGFKHITII